MLLRYQDGDNRGDALLPLWPMLGEGKSLYGENGTKSTLCGEPRADVSPALMLMLSVRECKAGAGWEGSWTGKLLRIRSCFLLDSP